MKNKLPSPTGLIGKIYNLSLPPNFYSNFSCKKRNLLISSLKKPFPLTKKEGKPFLSFPFVKEKSLKNDLCSCCDAEVWSSFFAVVMLHACQVSLLMKSKCNLNAVNRKIMTITFPCPVHVDCESSRDHLMMHDSLQTPKTRTHMNYSIF